MDFPKRAKQFLAVSLGLFFSSGLLGCVHETPPVHTPLPSRHSVRKPVVLDSTRKIVLFEHEGNYPKALEEAKNLQSTGQREKWTGRVLQNWSVSDLNKAQSMYLTGHMADATLLVDHALELQPDLIRKPRSAMTPELWTKFLLAKIDVNQELWVTQVVEDNSLLDDKQKKDVLFHSYLHLSQRRISEQKYHAALIDIRRALKLYPADPSALVAMKNLQDHLKLLTDKGYLEFTRQHLRRALFYWQQAVEIDPGDQDVKKNILKAKDLLKKLEMIERESGPPGNLPATPTPTPTH